MNTLPSLVAKQRVHRGLTRCFYYKAEGSYHRGLTRCFYWCVCVSLTQVLVLGNKVDLPNALRERELIERL